MTSTDVLVAQLQALRDAADALHWMQVIAKQIPALWEVRRGDHEDARLRSLNLIAELDRGRETVSAADEALNRELDKVVKAALELDHALVRARELGESLPIWIRSGARSRLVSNTENNRFNQDPAYRASLRAIARDRDREYINARGRRLFLTTTLARATASIQAQVVDLQSTLASKSSLHIEPARRATRVVAVAVRLVPFAYQPRYREEFAAELYELAESGCSRQAQMARACSVLMRAWSLRRALPVPQADDPPPQAEA